MSELDLPGQPYSDHVHESVSAIAGGAWRIPLMCGGQKNKVHKKRELSVNSRRVPQDVVVRTEFTKSVNSV